MNDDIIKAQYLIATTVSIFTNSIKDKNILEIEDINQIFSRVLYEFPIEQININFPRWVDSLDNSHWLTWK